MSIVSSNNNFKNLKFFNSYFVLMLILVIICCCRCNEINTNDADDDEDDDKIDISFYNLKIFGMPNLNNGKNLNNWTPESKENPEELSDYEQGDILIPRPIIGRNGLIQESFRWPDGIIKYEIFGDFSKYAALYYLLIFFIFITIFYLI